MARSDVICLIGLGGVGGLMAGDPTSASMEGVVDRVVFRNRLNGYCVLRVKTDKAPGLQTVVGAFQELACGERVRFSGKWVRDKKFGRQFKADSCLPLSPATLVGIEAFLGSGMISGIGKVMAGRIVAALGMDTLEIIESDPERLTEIDGIGKVRAHAISRAVKEKREVRNVMVFLESCGISPAYAHRIYKRYGHDAIRVVSENPYRLASDVHGIGFKMADVIAERLGIPKNSVYRAEAGILFTLTELSKSGHVFVPKEILLPEATALLEIDAPLLSSALERLTLMGAVRQHIGDENDVRVYLKSLDTAEKDAGTHLVRILSGTGASLTYDPQQEARAAEERNGIQLAPRQEDAFSVMQQAKVMVLTGGPGTGKTTLINGLIQCLAHHKQSMVLAAPTGRAAKRMSESTGYRAKTIHRLLEFAPREGGFLRNENNPLHADVIIVDEVSMVDIELFAALLKAIPSSSRILLIGDPDQLPSVGPGLVLGDLLTLGARLGPCLGVVCLDEIFRQARTSLIVTGAHAILNGQMPPLGKRGSSADFFMVKREDPQECLDVLKDVVARRIPAAFGFDAIADIQVLTPMHKGILGVTHLNAQLQQLLNPSKTGVVFRDVRYCPGDKVMQLRNNYDLDVYNGDVGTVVAVDEEGDWIRVDYGYKQVDYPTVDLDQTSLAFACSIHKSQGSEYPAVVIPIHTQHFVMLQRTLLYTAITRGQKLVVLVGSERALKMAVRNNDAIHRWSGLVTRLDLERAPFH